MILDAVPFREIFSESDSKSKALRAFVDYIESKLGVRVLNDLHTIPFGRPDLAAPLRLASLLLDRQIIKEAGPSSLHSDVPRMKSWYAIGNDPSSHSTGGTSWESDVDALYAALAEALERYIWFTQTDYFKRPKKATTEKISRSGAFIAPENISGFSEEQRTRQSGRILRPDAEYLWIQSTSLVHGGNVYLPAQVVSGLPRQTWNTVKEPFIRQSTTNGLATWPTRDGARLSGMLEVIEREAYMIMWLNQLTLPRISVDSLCAQSPSLARVVAACARYRFKIHVIPLPTDAPTSPVAVVLEDISGTLPRFTLGLKAHQSLPYAAEKAMMEAFRARKRYRVWADEKNTWDMQTPIEKIGHLDRLFYWGVPEHAKHLEFIVRGKEVEFEQKVWEKDTIDEHYRRLVLWCKETNLQCVSVSLGDSAKNPTDFFIEMIVMPQLQSAYLEEILQQFGGTRWRDVAKKLGYTPRERPFADRPHPFS